MHYFLLICVNRFARFPLVRRFHVFTFLPVNLINAFIPQALGQSDHGMIPWPALARSTHTSINDTEYRKNTIKLDLYSIVVFCMCERGNYAKR